MFPAEPHICVCIAEADLREWVKDELLLMTWVGTPRLSFLEKVTPEVAAAKIDLLIVGVDRLDPGERDRLQSLASVSPVIAIGTSAREGGFTIALGPKLTSRELKQAIRTTLLEPQAQSAAIGCTNT